jgi:hypothetical protein
MKAVLILGLGIALLFCLLAAPEADAKGRKPHQQQALLAGAECSESPNPLGFREYGTITGSGFPAEATLGAVVSATGTPTSGGGTAVGLVVTDAAGSFSLTSYGGWTGTVTLSITQSDGLENIVLAACNWEVLTG